MANLTLVESNAHDAFFAHEEHHQLESCLRLSVPRAMTLVPFQELFIAVHTVGKLPPQLEPFQGGLTYFRRKYPILANLLRVEYLNNDILVRCNHKKPSDAIDWLLSGTIHRLLGHFHQGIQLADNPDWNVKHIEGEIQRLKFHIGDPCGRFVHCPILLQDKFNYIAAIPEHFMPTLKIPLKEGNYKEDVPDLERFCRENISASKRFLIKLPYTTNQKYSQRHAVQTVEEILVALMKLRDKYIGVLPYVMLQAFLQNNLEHKVVCFNGKALYEANVDNSNKPGGRKESFSKSITKWHRFKFAEEVISNLGMRCPFAELSNVVRVDLFFCDYLNRMVVNEIESLEANISAHHRDHEKQMFVQGLLSIYHANRLIRDVGTHLNQTLDYVEYTAWPSKWDVKLNVDRT